MGELKSIFTGIEEYGVIERKPLENIEVYGVIEKGIKERKIGVQTEASPPQTQYDTENRETDEVNADEQAAIEASATDSLSPFMTDEAPAADSLLPPVTDEAPATDSLPPLMTNKAPTTDDLSPFMTDEAPAADSLPPLMTNKAPAADSLPPSVTDEASATNDLPPSATDETPAADSLPPSATDESPAADSLPPSATDEAPATDSLPPSVTDEAPATDGLPPSATDEAPASDSLPPSVTDKAPATDGLPPSATDEAPVTDSLPPPATDEAPAANDLPPLMTDEAHPVDSLSPPVPDEAPVVAVPPPSKPRVVKLSEKEQKVKFSIGAKLVSIISALMVVSLGGMTIIGTLMIGKDVRLTAEDSNYSINKRSALSAQNTLETVYNDTLLLLNALTMLNSNDLLAEKGEAAVDFFFRNNREVGAICVNDSIYKDEEGKQLFVNRNFMVANRLTATQMSDYINTQVEAASLAQDGEYLILNVTPFFNVEMIEMLFPWKNGDIESSVSVFFSIERLKEIFSDNVNHSFIINGTGDVLVDPDPALVRAGVNLRNKPFIKQILEGNTQNIQSTYDDEDGMNFFAYKRLSIGNAVVITVISSKEVFKGVVSTTWRNILLSASVLLLSILFILLFARHLSKPLQELTKAAGQIESGFYHINILSKHKDEIGILSNSFNSMSRGLLSFEKFTNKSLANLARSGKLVTGGVDRKATIFFSDIRGFTAISEKLKPDEIVEFLNDYLDRMVACVNATGGIVDKFIGDAVMAHWGAVDPSGDLKRDALNCVKTALMMRASLRSFNEGRGGDKKPVIKIGCGINSGNLIAGQIGSNERLEYTVIGDAVSFADRVETFNKPFGTEILISESVWKLCGEFLITEEMPSVMEKRDKVRMFAVVNMEDPDEVDNILKLLDAMPKNARRITRHCIGQSGPQTLADVRALLGIATPDLSKVNTDEEEKKYKIAESV
jgi:adenylate cyclase